MVSGDDVTLDTSGATGTFDSKDAGTGKTVTIAGLTLSGADAGKYVLADPMTTTADITAATLTVDGITATDKVYDGTTTAALDTSAASLVGVVSGDDVTLDSSGAVGTFDTKDVGTGINVTVSGLALAGADAGNYVLTQPTHDGRHHGGDADGDGPARRTRRTTARPTRRLIPAASCSTVRCPATT